MRRLLRQAERQLAARRQAWFQRGLARRGNELEPGCVVPRGSEIGTRLRVGRETRFAGPVVILGGEPVSFGRYCLAGRGLRVFSSNHRTDVPAVQDSLQPPGVRGHHPDAPGPVSIGHGAWIGDGSIVLPGVRIGNGAVIGAGSVVTREVAPFAIAAGSPARELRRRFDEQVIAELEALAWWDWTPEQIRAQPRLFGADLTASRVRDHFPPPGATAPVSERA